jgi:hypothetical protein
MLDALRVNAWSRALCGASHRVAVTTLIVHIFEVESMNMSGEVPGNSG